MSDIQNCDIIECSTEGTELQYNMLISKRRIGILKNLPKQGEDSEIL